MKACDYCQKRKGRQTFTLEVGDGFSVDTREAYACSDAHRQALELFYQRMHRVGKGYLIGGGLAFALSIVALVVLLSMDHLNAWISALVIALPFVALGALLLYAVFVPLDFARALGLQKTRLLLRVAGIVLALGGIVAAIFAFIAAA